MLPIQEERDAKWEPERRWSFIVITRGGVPFPRGRRVMIKERSPSSGERGSKRAICLVPGEGM